MNQRLRALALLLLIICSSFIPGCWSRKEIEDLAIVTLLGVDKVAGQNNQGQDVWQVSAKVLQPQPATQSGGGNNGATSTGGGAGVGQALLFKGTGATLQEATRDLMIRSPRFIFLGYVSGLIVGEKAAREGVAQIVDLQARFRQFRLRTYILVTPGEAFDVLQAHPEVDDTLAKEIQGLEENKVDRIGISCGIDSNQFIQTLLSPDRDPVAGEIYVVKPQEDPTVAVDKAVVIKGLAVFHGDKLVGWLNKKETFGYIVNCGVNSAMIPITVIDGDKVATYLIGKVESKIEAKVTGGEINYRVKVKTWGEVDEVKDIQVTPEALAKIEQMASATVRSCVLATIDKSRQLNADILGFTQQLHRTELTTWQTLGPTWRDSWREADIEVEVDARVIQSGKTGRELMIKK
ncbi:MAG: Ger(x)C family spore germination protein [Peptococcaceae bacterium]|nr:Ger(x)C family spore germination protein [Peptococcaceae bacterium]